jgi:uncharacterized protein
MLATLFTSTFAYQNTPTASAVSSTIVISQFQVAGSIADDEFIELHNVGSTAYDLNGHTFVYRSTGGTTDTSLGVSWTTSTSIPAGGYYLIARTTYDGAIPGDKTYSSGALGGAAGGVALRNGAANTGTIVDSVGYGTATNAFIEGTVTAAPAANTSQVRKTNGCQDTDNNSADFVNVNPSTPRNSTSTAVLCGGPPVDNAPTVASTIPTNNAIDIAINSDITITFSEPVTVTNGWVSLTTGSPATTVPISYTGGPTTFTINPDADLVNSQTYTVTVVAANVTDRDGTPTPMTANYVFSFTTIAPGGGCPSPATTLVSIPALQGTTDTNTANGQNRTVRGVVVADYQGATGLFGFNIQDPAGDANPATSDGVFVFVPAANTAWINFDVAVGDSVQVSGRATEFNGLTEIDTVTSIVKCGTNQMLAPTVVDLPEVTNNELERFEGMLVSIPETLTVDQNFFQGRYGQVTLSSDGRLYNPTNNNLPNSPGAIAQFDLNARRLIVLDDAFSGQNPNPIPYIGQDNTLRAGDTVAGITGTLDFGPINSVTTIRDYRVQPTVAPVITRANQRTAAPEAVGGNVKVASFNVLNYFNGDGQGGGFPTSRGANTPAEFSRQRAKIISAIVAINADVLGLMEMENDAEGPLSAIQDLVNGLNAATAPGTYAIVPNPVTPFGTDEIKVALIYKPARVTRFGAAQTLQDPIFDRLPFAQTFQLANGEKFSVIVNHFKSKGSCPTDGSADTDQGDGQGCWNAKRVQQAQTLLTLVNTLKSSSGDNDVLIIGDLNAYGKENPITTLTSNGFVNEIEKLIGSTAYSYVFDGFAGYLDHALASTSLDSQVSGVTEWHINADEPSVIDYNTEFKPQDLYTPTPYRSSDHDPVVIGLQLGGNLTPASFAGSAKTVNATTVQAGKLLTYTLTISNSGQTASTYMLTDTLNANLTFVSASPTMSQSGQQLTASGSVGPNSQQQYVITVRVNAAFSGVINNSATLSGDGQTRTLTAPPVTVTPAPTAANFSTSTKTVNANTVVAGQLLTYTLTVINSGQLPATYMLTDTLNANLTFVSATPVMTRSGQQLSASGILNGGSSVTYTIVVRVSDSFSGALNNSATLSGDGQTRTLTAPVVAVQSAKKKIYLPFIIR